MLEAIMAHWQLSIGAIVLGATVGTLTGFFGAGGGFIITPALNIFLGLEMNIAVGTSVCQVLGASAFSLYNHFDKRMMGVKVALFSGIGIPPGAFIGTWMIKSMKGMQPVVINGVSIDSVNFILMIIFAGFLFLIGGWMMFDNFFLRRHSSGDDSDHVGLLFRFRLRPLFTFRTIPAGAFSVPVLIILGLFMGFLSGLLGIGGGVIMLPILFYLVGQETKFASQSTTMLIFLSGIFSTVFHAIDHNIDYKVAAMLVFGAFFGARLGAKLQKKVHGKAIRQYFAFVVLAAWLMVLYKLFRMIYQ